MSSKNLLIEARNLVKIREKKKIIDELHFQVSEGESFGIVGPARSGKTALMQMMYCATPISDGELFVLGLNVKKAARDIKAQIGVVPQEHLFDPELSVFDNLFTYLSYQNFDEKKPKSWCMELLRYLRIEEFADEGIEGLSQEVQKKVLLARGLINRPKILFLDQPTAGLTPDGRAALLEKLKKENENGTCLVLATDDIEEAQYLCHNIALLDGGRFLCHGRPSELVRSEIGKEVVEFSFRPSDLEYYLARLRSSYDYQVFHNRIRLFIREGQEGKEAFKNISSDHIVVRRATLDDVFLKLSGHEIMGAR